MTTPVVLAVSEALANGVTSLDVPTPTGTASGDLLLVIVAVDAVTASTSMSGFTALYENEVSETFITASAYYRIADGTEGANLTVALSGAEDIVARAYRIDGYSGTPEVEFVSTGNSTIQTSPPITPAGGSDDYLYLVFDHIDTSNGLINTFPTGYTGTGSVANTRCRLGYGVKSTIATTSETPTDWVLSATRRTVTSTIAISPVSGGGGITLIPPVVNSSSLSLNPAIAFNSTMELTPVTVNSSSISLSPVLEFSSALVLTPNTISSSSVSINPTVIFSGTLEINPSVVNSSSTGLNPNIQFISSLSLTPNAIDSMSVALNPFIEYTSALVIASQTINSASISIDPLIEFKSVINLTPESINSLSASRNPIISTGQVQTIGTVTAGFAADLYSVKYKLSGITVNFKE